MLTKISSLLVALLFASSAYAAPNIQHWQTKNGAKVFFVAAPELPIVDISVTFDAGSARDGRQSGLALLTNALIAEGTGKLDGTAISEQFESVGAQFSNHSAKDMALFSLRTLTDPDAMKPAVSMFAQVISSPSFPKKALQRERKRLLIGIQGKKQSPGALSSEAFNKEIFASHPYAAPAEGTEESIQALKRSDLTTFYKQYYVAKNATIALVGALSRDEAERLSNTITNKLTVGQAAAALPEVGTLQQAKELRIKHPSSQSHVLVGQPGIYRGDADYFPLYVGNHILGGSGLISKLSTEIRENRGLAYSSYSYFSPMRKHGPFIMGFQTRNDQANEALDVAMQTLRSYLDKGPSEEELVAAKKNITGGFPLNIASNKSILGYIAMIGFYGLPLDYLDQFQANINALSTKQIKEAFQRRIHPDKLVTVVVGGTVE